MTEMKLFTTSLDDLDYVINKPTNFIDDSLEFYDDIKMIDVYNLKNDVIENNRLHNFLKFIINHHLEIYQFVRLF